MACWICHWLNWSLRIYFVHRPHLNRLICFLRHNRLNIYHIHFRLNSSQFKTNLIQNTFFSHHLSEPMFFIACETDFPTSTIAMAHDHTQFRRTIHSHSHSSLLLFDAESMACFFSLFIVSWFVCLFVWYLVLSCFRLHGTLFVALSNIFLLIDQYTCYFHAVAFFACFFCHRARFVWLSHEYAWYKFNSNCVF